MSYIQFRDQKEVLATGQKTVGFLTEDHRLHDSIKILNADGISKDLGIQEILALWDLKTNIDMVCDGFHEMPFTDLVERARDFEKAFRRGLKALGHKHGEEK